MFVCVSTWGNIISACVGMCARGGACVWLMVVGWSKIYSLIPTIDKVGILKNNLFHSIPFTVYNNGLVFH